MKEPTAHQLSALFAYIKHGCYEVAAISLDRSQHTLRNHINNLNARLRSDSTIQSLAILVATGHITKERLQDVTRQTPLA